MKKPIMNIANLEALTKKGAKLCKEVKNALTEDAEDVVTSLEAFIDELRNADVEYDEAAFAEKVREMIEAYNGDEKSEVPAAVANAIAARVKAMQNAMPASEKLTPAIKNQVSAAILKARGREDVENAVNAVLVKNGISGLSSR